MNRKPSNIAILLLFLFVNSFSFSQEICGDGMDNDSDGFTDCDDSECYNPLTFNGSVTDADCFAANTGSINISPVGGTGTLVFDWDNDGTGDFDDTQDLSSLAAGTYNLQIRDDNLCTFDTSIVVGEPANMLFNGSTISTSCTGNSDGEINIAASGGTGVLQYDWDNDGTGDFDDSANQSGLLAGTYNLQIRDANLCTFDTTIIVSDPQIIFDPIVTHPSCGGDLDGAIDLQAIGGELPYKRFDWDHISGLNNPEDLTGLAAGSFTVTIRDNNNCDFDTTIVLIDPLDVIFNGTVTNVDCNGASTGAIDISPVGGTGTLVFDWDNDGTGDFDDTEDLTSLTAGTYNLQIRDDNLCTYDTTIVISESTNVVFDGSTTNVACGGGSTGAIDISPVGGTGTLVFDWDNDGTGDFDDTEDLTSLTAGTYNLQIRDDNLCTYDTTIVISESTNVVFDGSTTNVACGGGSTGAIDISPVGGTGTLVFDWDNDGTGDFDDTEDLTGLTAGTYNLQIRDDNLCTYDTSIVIIDPSIVIFNGAITDVLCNGATTGAIDISPIGGTGTLVFDWDTDGTGDFNDTEDLNSISAGSYTLQTRDDNLCVYDTTIVISESASLLFNGTINDVDCNGASTGAIDISPVGGTGTLLFDWDNDGTGDFDDTEDLTSLTAGTYNLQIRDDNLCTYDTTIVISESTNVVFDGSTTNVACGGGSTGAIDISPVGGTGTLVFDWDNDGTGDFDDTEDLTSLTAGTYNLQIRDDNLCTYDTTIVITENGDLTFNGAVTNIACNGASTGAIDISPIGGTGTLVFDWDNDGTGDFDDTEDLTALTAGTYNLQIRDDNLCTYDTAIVITEPANLVFDASLTTVDCNGASSGAIDISPIGGTGTLVFDWDTDGTGDFDDTEDLTGLTAGTYNLQIRDDNLCVYDTTIIISEPSELTFDGSITNVLCNGASTGEIAISPVGGTGTLVFDWDNDGTGDFDDTEDLSSISAGTYNLQIRDDNLCTYDTVIVISENSNVLFNGLTTSVLCNGASTGAIDISPVGGTGTLLFDWDTDLTGDFDDTEDLTSLLAGTYNLQIQDDNFCLYDTTIVVNEPAEVFFNASVVDVTCNGASTGAIDISPVGGTGTLVFDWDNDGTGDFDDTEDLTAMPAGTYNLQIRDDNLCVFDTTIIINESNALVFNGATTNVDCNASSTGAIDISPIGGTGTLVFDWDNDGTGDFDDTEDLTALSAGTYNLQIRDDNLCVYDTTIVVTEPDAMLFNGTVSNVNCNGFATGEINIDPVGGTGTLAFDWDNDGTGDFDDTEDLTTLSEGTYVLQIRDANLCTYDSTFVITEPNVLTLTEVHNNITCNGDSDGSITLTPGGGTLPYTFDWVHILGSDDTQDLTNLPQGNYSVTLTDALGCAENVSVTIEEPALLTLTEIHEDIECNGASDGTITLTPNGGTLPYTFDWAHIIGTDDVQDLTGLGQGSYTVVLTDANLCSETLTIDIDEESDLIFTEIHTDVTCNGADDGTITLSASGGAPAYQYDWAHIPGPNNTANLTGLEPNTYNVVLTDQNNCSKSLEIIIEEPDVVVLSESHTDVTCNGADDGTITLTTSGGSGVYTYNWDHIFGSDNPQSLTGLAPNSYSVVVQDENNCLDNISITINEPLALTLEESHTDVTCNGADDGTITLNPTGGNGSFTFDWDHLAGTNNIQNLSDLEPDTYSVTVTDSKGCTDNISITINEPDVLQILESNIDIFCNGLSTGSIDINVLGGNGSYVYDWAHITAGTEPQDLSGLPAGTYTLTVTDSKNCSDNISIDITEPPALALSMSMTETSCSSLVDGTATATPSGGTGAGTYDYLWTDGEITQTITGKSAGTYSVTITDDNGCQITDDITIPNITLLNITDISVLSDYSGQDISCAGASDGFASVTVTGGTTDYSYSWNSSPVQNLATLQNVPAGTYTVTVTDDRGCVQTADITLNDPPALNLSIDYTEDYNGENVSCFGEADGAAEVSVSGGIGGYTYSWDTSPVQTTSEATGLAAGTYTVTVTDDESCQSTESITLTQPNELDVSLIISDYDGFGVSCADGNDGTITSTVTGGTGPFDYLWSNTVTSPNLNNVEDGTYSVTVTDVNGCTTSESASLTEPTTLTFTTLTSPPTDCDIDNGIITVNASGGITPYEYSLDGTTWQSESYFQFLATGSYNVYVRNGLGTCVIGPVVTIIDAAEAPAIDNTVIINPTGAASADGGILIQASGNGLAIQYSIDNINWQSSDLFSGLNPGTYTIYVRYVGQTCFSSFTATLVAGGGVIGSTSDTEICSQNLSGTTFEEIYYIPIPEDDLLTAFTSIYGGGCGGTTPSSPIFSYNSIGVVESGTIINFDHWEDGYEGNLGFPVQPSTQIWGDNDPSNGIPPGFAIDYLNAGDIITLNNNVDVTNLANIDYDGRDKFGSYGDLSFSRMVWSTGPGVYMAGAAEVYSLENWATNYEIPMGVDADVGNMFEYTGATIMAANNGTVVTINNGGSISTVTLNEGDSHLIDGGINIGATITATDKIQIVLMTADICAGYETRFYSLTSPDLWSNRYYNPVSTQASNPTNAIIYNPNGSAITVNYEGDGWTGNTGPIAAGSRAVVVIPDGTGSHFYSADGSDFYVLATIDSPPASWGTGADWGYALLPFEQLSGQITLVGFAPGYDPTITSGNNSSPIWITGDHPTGSIYSGNNITISIDYNGDGTADATQTISELGQARIFDTSDDDQTGMKIWVSDGSDAFIAGAYGQDADLGTPLEALDLGTGLFNKIPFSSTICVDLYTDYLNNDIYDECDEVIYTVTVKNTGSLPLAASSLALLDTLPSELAYVPNTTQLFEPSGISTIPDDVGPNTEFPLDQNGYGLSAIINPGDSVFVQFVASINSTASAAFVQNIAYVTNGSTSLTPEVSFPLQNPLVVSLPGIPNDTILNCDATILNPPYQDTCLTKIYLNPESWSVHAVTSQETSSPGLEATSAFDSDPDTYWSTKYFGGIDPYPHELEIDLGISHDFVNGFRYQGRTDLSIGRIENYEIYTSMDGITWGAPVAAGTWMDVSTPQDVSFDGVSAQYIKLRALSAIGGGSIATAAEISISKCSNQVAYSESNTQTSNSTCTDYSYDINRFWTVTNFCGNVGVESQTISLQDTIAPVLSSIPADAVVLPGSVPAPATVTATDNCDTGISVVYDADTIPIGCNTQITRTWTATDLCGNSASGEQILTVLTCDEDCTNGIDDDGDGLIDCDDPDCSLSLFLLPSPDTTICEGNSINVSALPQNGTSPYTVSWDNGLPNGTSHTVSPVVNTTYTATVSDDNGCQSDTSITITVDDDYFTGIVFNNLGSGDDVPVTNGGIYNISLLPASFNIEALLTGTTGSVQLALTGAASGTVVDNSFPYRYNGDFVPFTPTPGTYSLTVRNYADPGAVGQLCDQITVSFTLLGEEICGNGIDDNGDGQIDETSPAGISSNLLLWVKANAGFSGATWEDQSSNNNDGTNTGSPTLTTNSLNFNPGVSYDGSNYTAFDLPELVFESGNNSVYLFAVYKPNTTSSAIGIFGNESPTNSSNIGISNGQIEIGNGSETVPEVFGNSAHITTYIIDEEDNVNGAANSSEIIVNGASVHSFLFNENIESGVNNTFYLGKSGDNPGSLNFNGEILEFIVYYSNDGTAALTSTEKQKIESYLSVKYGLGLPFNIIGSQ